MSRSIFLLAGEASGDLHGANLARALLKQDPSIRLDGWGGSRMSAAGVTLHRGLKDLAFMGYVEVLANIMTIRRSFALIKKYLSERRPDALVLIDYPGFNLKIARWAHNQGIRVFYFISPTVWAWKEKRVYTIRESVDRLYCIFPFEVDFYKRYDVDVTYVGNPLLDNVAAYTPDPDFTQNNSLNAGQYIAVLPGSRLQELYKIFPLIVETMKTMPGRQFVIARTSLLPENSFTGILDKHHPGWQDHISLITDRTYDVLHNASSAMVTSGTATLETALLRIPEVVCYITNPVNYRIARAFVRLRYISLVNLIADRPIVKELIQSELNVRNLAAELTALEEDTDYRNNMLSGYEQLAKMIGEPGVAERMAADMLNRIYNNI